MKLKSLPPAPLQTMIGLGPAPSPTVSGTSAAIQVPRTRRPLLFIAGFAVAAGAVIGIAAMWSGASKEHAPARTESQATEPPHATAPAIPPATPATVAQAPPPATAQSPSASAAPLASASGAPAATAHKPGPAPRPRPGDQVGAAGISNQF